MVEGFLDSLHQAPSVRWQLDPELLDRWLRRNPNHSLFDALDDVFDPGLRREVIIAVHHCADACPWARIVVTTRIIGFEQQVWSEEGFKPLMLEDLFSDR